ncbi:hypothetical protein ES319_D11G102700v1 [Gossypium barbadense]|uniref:Uncharacterized protein n=1 Tax=Gossypium barbadense TaxID=3634 RepID=A0A5J5P964_GOSBA|nr:hypothetical protein ES319_D11G102700v1 [Gossypium barbadense]
MPNPIVLSLFFYSEKPRRFGSDSSQINLEVSLTRIDFASMILPFSFLTIRPDADLWFCESKAASKKMGLFALRTLCLGLALTSKLIPTCPDSPQLSTKSQALFIRPYAEDPGKPTP